MSCFCTPALNTSRFYMPSGRIIWRSSHITSSLSQKIWLVTTGKLLMRKWTSNLTKKTINLTIPQQWSKIWCIRIKFRIILQAIWINHRLRFLPLWSQIRRRLYHWKVEIPQKKVICGLSNMRSAHQSSMNSSSI